MTTVDFLVIGGGVIGLAVALEAKRRQPDARVALIEKEPVLGMHASARNSGVLHAGFYYAAGSLKARFTRDGNRRWVEYCQERRLPLLRCGKLVVTRSGAELPALDELARRGAGNGVEVHVISEADARRLEPRVRTVERALHAPTTASVLPGPVIQALAEDAAGAGIELRTGVRYDGVDGGRVRTSHGPVAAGYVINAAGVHADRVASDFGFSQNHRILPFRGHYLRAAPGAEPLRLHIYPVPDLAQPFLGVHLTVLPGGGLKIGPTAEPALGREHYGGWRGLDPAEAVAILARNARLLAADRDGYRRHARIELRKRRKATVVAMAARLASGIHARDFPRRGDAGIRAQLVDLRSGALEPDFRIEGDDSSLHILNAVSPGFTCALPFAAHVLDEAERLMA